MGSAPEYDLSLYDYHLPRELVAQEPARPRSSSRLMVLHPAGAPDHRRFSDIVDILGEGDVLVMNDSRVIPARLRGRKTTGGRAEVLLLGPGPSGAWEALCGGRGLGPGSRVILDDGSTVFLDERISQGRFRVSFDPGVSPWDVMERIGEPPTPPYIKKVVKDPEDYQTVYARISGSVAAPTAGLHFDEPLLKALELRGVELVHITLHVGIGTFREVRCDDIRDHGMEVERFQISPGAAERLGAALEDGRRIFPVGTTAVRTLESAAGQDGTIAPGAGSADIYIYPGYRFKLPFSGMFTNFHLPRSTPIMMASAIAGRERILEAYREAIDLGYRFYSFGDAMLMLRRGR